jgi:hypothetical protein
MQIEIVGARNICRHIAKAAIFGSREEFLVTTFIPPVPVVLVLEFAYLVETRVSSLNHYPPTFFDWNRSQFPVEDFHRSVSDLGLGVPSSATLIL